MADKDKIIKQITVGWEEWVSLDKLGLPAIKAKIDTGAKTSALHAFSVERYGTEKKPKVRFGIHPVLEYPELSVYCSADLIDQRDITSSNGETEQRYIIKTMLTMGGESWPIEISLTNRETMMYRMLIGRSALEGRTIIHPTESCMLGELDPEIYLSMSAQKEYKRNLSICILSREPDNYSTTRLVEAAEERGHSVEVVDTARCYMNITANGPDVQFAGRSLRDFDVIIPRIGSSITFYGMAVVRQFEAIGIYCLNSSDSIGRSRDKLFAHQLLAKRGIGMPNTGFAHSPNDTKGLINFVGGAPLVLKLLEGTQGRGVVLAETNKAAESVITAFRGLKANILVQEFIKESKGEDIRCFVVGNKVVGAMKRSAQEGEFRSNLHMGGAGSKVKITPEERKTAVRAAKALGLNVAGVDIIRSDSGPNVLEVNSSPGLEGIEKITGKDIAGLILEYIENHAKTRRKIKAPR